MLATTERQRIDVVDNKSIRKVETRKRLFAGVAGGRIRLNVGVVLHADGTADTEAVCFKPGCKNVRRSVQVDRV